MSKSLIDMLVDSVFDEKWVGRRGEKLSERELKWVQLFGRSGKILRNVYVPRPDGGTSEIDVLYITQKGIFVIESKNYSGWIFGSEDQYKWTVSLPGGHKERFYNPVRQNIGHIKWLGAYLDERLEREVPPLFSLVVFSERCELKKVSVDTKYVRVIKRDRLYATVRSIWDVSPDVADEAQVEEMFALLQPLTDVTKAEKAAHVERIKGRQGKAAKDELPERDAAGDESSERDAAEDELVEIEVAEEGPSEDIAEAEPAEPAVPTCPRCGAPMVLRTAKRGANAGNQFYGCSNYPHCRGIINME